MSILSDLDFESIVFLGGLFVFLLGMGVGIIPQDLEFLQFARNNSFGLLSVGGLLMAGAVGIHLYKNK
ncbi:MAG: hypothetical protein HeimC3_35570 [Candidatus Heimdallarchaeota archaeon LC_3]|nr:MAG: hypothetical protein HeimC3_35570 [Candidatus Heimdallarchaeota archaeon LC_3]